MIRKLGAVCALVAMTFSVFVVSIPAFADEGNTPGQLIAPGPPPLPPYEVATTPPGGGYIWVPGHWSLERRGLGPGTVGPLPSRLDVDRGVFGGRPGTPTRSERRPFVRSHS
jgi:hypothetical protein